MRKSSKILFVLGILLILGSLVIVAAYWLQAQRAQANAAKMLAQINAVLPPKSVGTMDAYSSMEMPVLQIDNQDFIAIVDIPAFGIMLPVYSTWDAGKATSCPCRFSGTVYDGTLIIGGTDQKGQFDCFDQIQHGNTVTVTDMNGAEFSYTVSRIDRTKSAEADILIDEMFDLTLFVRDAYSLEYMIVRCSGNVR